MSAQTDLHLRFSDFNIRYHFLIHLANRISLVTNTSLKGENKMTNYSIKTISENYKMTAFGVSFDDYNDWGGNAAKTAAKKAEITENGKLAELLALADGQEYQINYNLDRKPWRGFGVMGEFNVEGAVVLNFLAG